MIRLKYFPLSPEVQSSSPHIPALSGTLDIPMDDPSLMALVAFTWFAIGCFLVIFEPPRSWRRYRRFRPYFLIFYGLFILSITYDLLTGLPPPTPPPAIPALRP